MGFRFRQSFSLRARTLSAARLLRRSSCSTIGTLTSVLSASAIASTIAVCSLGSPLSRRGYPSATAESPSDSAASASISSASAAATRDGAPATTIVFHGRASMPVASESARPIRFRP
jgi:hypothetical protein